MTAHETSKETSDLPCIIQGGMGVGVSNWTLANAVSKLGQLGVVSGTCVDSILVRRLQDGDIGGHVRRAMAHFPIPNVAEAVLSRFFLPEGRPPRTPYKALPMYKQSVSLARQQITMIAAFVEVWLAREGHSKPVGMNLLTKVQMPNLPTLYGAMLAGVGYVLMGAGIPREIPGLRKERRRHRGVADMIGDPRTPQPSTGGVISRTGSDLVDDRTGNAERGREGFDEVKVADFAEENER
jgi:NAD(P)H-dependent flavin oxidoreductase YrpB (nitropropane dioxygenase family)